MATGEEIKQAIGQPSTQDAAPARGLPDTSISYQGGGQRPAATSEVSTGEMIKQEAEGPSFLEDVASGAGAQVKGLRNLLVQAMTGQKLPEAEAPDTLGGRIGEVGTEALTYAIPGGAAASRVRRAAEGAKGIRAGTRNVVSDIGRSFRERPGRFLATETALGGAAGAGGFTAEKMFPESSSARLLGELFGGGAPAAIAGTGRLAARGAGQMPGGRAVRAVGRSVRRIRDPLATRTRAEDRMSRAAPDRQQAAQRMDEDLVPGLTPAAQAGDPGLLGLERSVERELSDADQFINQSIDNVQENIRQEIRNFGQTSPEVTAQTYERSQRRLTDSLDAKVRTAAQKADQQLAKLGPNVSRENANNIFSRELRNAHDELRQQESSLYDLIPQDAIAPTTNTTGTFNEIRSSLSRAESEDVPSVAKQLIGQEGGLGQTTTIKELRGLQSKLREAARNARSGDNANFNKARIADNLANAITDDIADAQGGEAVSGAVDTAVSFSRNLNERFRRGTVGELLGYGPQGAERVPASLSLERSIGGSGPQARQAYDDILNATDNNNVRQAMSEFFKNKFTDYAVEGGEINPSRARTFLRNNSEVLGRIPELRNEIDQAMSSLDARSLRTRQRGRVNFKPSVSKATMFIERGPTNAFNNVLRSRSPSREMANLVNMAKRDETGEAVQGLKSAFSDYIQDRVTTSAGDFSGVALRNFLNDEKTQTAMKRLYTDDEINRWNRIGRTVERLDMQRAARPSGEGITGDAPSRPITLLAQLLGARSGSAVAQATGTGGIQMQAVMSNAYRDLVNRGIDPARRLIMDSVQDRELFRDVLMSEVKQDGTLPEQTRRRLNAWVASVVPEEEEEE